MTYPDPAVDQALATRFVGLKLDHRSPQVRPLSIVWLPTVLIADKRGTIYVRSINALPPEDFLDVIDLGDAQARLREARYEHSVEVLSAGLARRPESPLADEMLYWLGIASYFRGGHDHAGRDAAWSQLRVQFPHSIWTRRVPGFVEEYRDQQ